MRARNEIAALRREVAGLRATLDSAITALAARLEAETQFRRWQDEDLGELEDRVEAALEALLEAEPNLPGRDDTVESFIRRMIDANLTVEFDYTDAKGEESTRRVSPYELRPNGHGPNLVGYDHGREAIRQFRLDRIELPGPCPVQYRQPEES